MKKVLKEVITLFNGVGTFLVGTKSLLRFSRLQELILEDKSIIVWVALKKLTVYIPVLKINL